MRQQVQRNDGVVEARHAIDMRADSLPGQIFIRDHLVRQVRTKSVSHQPGAHMLEPFGQRSQIGIGWDRPRLVVVAVTEVPDPALELRVPLTGVETPDERRFLVRGNERGQINGSSRQIRGYIAHRRPHFLAARFFCGI